MFRRAKHIFHPNACLLNVSRLALQLTIVDLIQRLPLGLRLNGPTESFLSLNKPLGGVSQSGQSSELLASR